jgi:hypothetical protein
MITTACCNAVKMSPVGRSKNVTCLYKELIWKRLRRGDELVGFLRHVLRRPLGLDGIVVDRVCLVKHSRALRGRNPAKDNQVEGAPLARATPGQPPGVALFSMSLLIARRVQIGPSPRK